MSLALSTSTNTLFIATGNGGLHHYQRDETSLAYNSIRTLKGHTDNIQCMSLSHAKMHLLSGGDDKTLRVWDVSNDAHLACLN
jgi:WD40 repeat protein